MSGGGAVVGGLCPEKVMPAAGVEVVAARWFARGGEGMAVRGV